MPAHNVLIGNVNVSSDVRFNCAQISWEGRSPETLWTSRCWYRDV